MVLLFCSVVLLVFLLEVVFVLRARFWRRICTNPAFFFLLGFSLLGFGLFFAVRDRFFAPETRALVFSIDPRMDQDTILRVKSIIKKVVQEVSCSFGLSNEQGVWLAPVSEDRVFFLLQLEQVVASSIPSMAPFIPNRSDFPKGSLLVVFSSFGSEIRGAKETVLFEPIASGTWTMIVGREKNVVETAAVAQRIKDCTLQGGEQAYSYGLVEKELYGLLLLGALFCIWRYRRALPWLSLGLFMVYEPLYGLSESSVVSALVTNCGEKEVATKYLIRKYLTDVSEQNRSVYAYNLALISARFGDIKEALSWMRLIDSPLLTQREVGEFLRDLLSTLILQGDVRCKLELQTVLRGTSETDLSKAVLLFQPGGVSNNLGLDEGILLVTTPAYQFLPILWQKEMLQRLGGDDLERSLITRSLATQSSPWDMIEFLIRVGFREARLYSLLRFMQPRQEQNAMWMKKQVLELSKKGVADSRVKEQVVPELFQKAWDQGKSLCERWDRCWYLLGVVRPSVTSPWVRALIGLQYLEQPNGALNLVLEAFFATISPKSLSFDSEFTTYLDNFFSVTALQIPQLEFDSLVSSLACLKDVTILPMFFQKSVAFLEQQKNLSALELLSASKMVIGAMKSNLSQLDTDQVQRTTIHFADKISQILKNKVLTRQEQGLVDALSSLKGMDGSVLEILEKTYDILVELDYLFKERNIEIVPEIASVSAAPKEFFIDKGDAIQLLIQLEQDEHALEERVK